MAEKESKERKAKLAAERAEMEKLEERVRQLQREVESAGGDEWTGIQTGVKDPKERSISTDYNGMTPGNKDAVVF